MDFWQWALANRGEIPAMAEIPDSKSALKRIARASISRGRRLAYQSRERREGRNELLGALLVLPLVRDVSRNFTFLQNLGLDEKLQTAAVSYGVAMFTKGMLSEVAWGSTIGAIGAYAYDSEGLLGGIFGGK
jgi:hypothetical protein